MRALAPSSRRCLHGTKGGSCCLALERASWLPVNLLVVLALASCFAFPGEFLLQASKRLALPLGGHARSPIRRANDRLRLFAGSPGHRRIPPMAVFALRDVRAGFMFAAQAACRACLGLLFRLSRRAPSASVQKTRPPLGGQARSPIRRANNRLRLSAGSPGHRRIPPVAVFALRDVRAGFMFGGQAVFCACLGLLFRLPRRVPFASVQKEPKDSPRHPAPAASRLGCPRCIVAPGGTPPRSFVDRGGSRGILPLVPLRNDSARPPDGAGLPPHHLEGKPHFVDARNPIRRADTAYGGIRPTGLHGNERRRLAVLLFLEFLSCLYGSERPGDRTTLPRSFLSCLYGSEPGEGPVAGPQAFLSCLYGSEPQHSLASRSATFLSCLYGSEQSLGKQTTVHSFLSCLYGSEPSIS